MNVLIACEYSGVVREAFRLRGHYALSNDLLPADDDSPYHIQGDCFDAIDAVKHWDIIIMHPPCTALAVSGNAWYGKGTYNCKEKHDALPRNKRMRLHYLPPSKDRWKIRSTTFQGIADAMASQWGQQPLINYGA